VSAELDGEQLLASLQEAANDELFELAERLFVADYRASNTNHQERAAHATIAAEAFLDHRDAVTHAARRQANTRARRAAKRASKAPGAKSRQTEETKMNKAPEHRISPPESIDVLGAVLTTAQVKCACCLSTRVQRRRATAHEHEEVTIEIQCADCLRESVVRVYGDGDGCTFVQVAPMRSIELMGPQGN